MQVAFNVAPDWSGRKTWKPLPNIWDKSGHGSRGLQLLHCCGHASLLHSVQASQESCGPAQQGRRLLAVPVLLLGLEGSSHGVLLRIGQASKECLCPIEGAVRTVLLLLACCG